MGLDKAKSLLSVKGTNTFLDLTAKQVLGMRKQFNVGVKFMLMNSFNTSKDTLDFFAEKYPSLAADPTLELMQNKVCGAVSMHYPPIPQYLLPNAMASGPQDRQGDPAARRVDNQPAARMVPTRARGPIHFPLRLR